MKEAFEFVMLIISILGMILVGYMPLLIWALLDKYGFLDEEESET